MESAIQPVAEAGGKRRYRTVEERRRIVEETLADGVSVAVVARRHGVNANRVFQWRKLYQSGLLEPPSHLQYSYCQSSSYAPSCPNGTSGNNGSVQCITDNVAPGRSVGYGYDPLQRMNSAKTCGSSAYPQWGLEESYDRFGNRLSQSVTAGSGPSTNMSFSNSNQPTGYTFDPSGNMTVEPLSPPNDMTYDGENRMTAFQGLGGAASYSYDGNGLRVEKSVQGGTTTVSIFSGNSVIAEYDNGAAPSAPSREYIYNGAGDTTGLLAMFSGGDTTYYHQDDLSVRLTTDGTSGSPTYGQVLAQQGTFPFGESWYQSGPASEWVFTSYDRDSESGLDYALARYYDSRTGTFCSADPLAGDPSDPQSWNRYPYGRNDPIDVTDPSGKSWWSSLLIGIGVGIGVAILPELAPAWFGATATGTGSVAFSSTTMLGGGNLALNVSEYTWSTAITLGGTAGAVGGAATNSPQAPQTQTPQKPNPDCNSQPSTSFDKAHKGDAAALASKMHVPTNFVLAMAGDESQYGTSPAALGANNFFGLHAGAPGSTPWSQNPILASFPGGGGFMASGTSYAQMAQPLLGGVKDLTNETQFFTAMHAKWGVGHSLKDYLNKMTGPKGVANKTKSRMNCP